MATYEAVVSSYKLHIYTPNESTAHKSAIYLNGDFGMAFLCFVPEGGRLGTNRKRPGESVFDVFYWMSSWAPIVDLLRNERPVRFSYEDTHNTAVISTLSEATGEGE